MEADDYQALLKQAESELGTTPGAYCSRKVAIRAMELLREAGQVQFDKLEKRCQEEVDMRQRDYRGHQQILERQAQAIKRLEEEKMKGMRLGSRIDAKPSVMWRDDENGFRVPYYIGSIDPIDYGKAQILDRQRLLDQQPRQVEESPFRKSLNRRIDEGSPWTQI